MAMDRIILRLDSTTFATGVTHVHTDWEISEKVDFTTTVLQSPNDTNNKLLKIFYGTLENKKYYARARMLLSTGYTTWTELKDFTPTELDNNTLGLTLPISVGVPTITTTSDRENHVLSNFSILVSDPAVIGDDVSYVSTTYVIEDINGKVVFVNRNDKVNKSSLLVSTVKLKPLAIYRVKAFKTTSSNDVSNIATVTIKTTNL